MNSQSIHKKKLCKITRFDQIASIVQPFAQVIFFSSLKLKIITNPCILLSPSHIHSRFVSECVKLSHNHLKSVCVWRSRFLCMLFAVNGTFRLFSGLSFQIICEITHENAQELIVSNSTRSRAMNRRRQQMEEWMREGEWKRFVESSKANIDSLNQRWCLFVHTR